MKIIAVGMNYAEHNKELHHSLELSEPTIFMKSDSSLLKDGKPFFIPDFSSEIHYETEIVVKIDRLGKNIAERFAHRYYNEVTVGIDFTARDLQRELRAKGLPWEISKAFDNSAVIGAFVPLEQSRGYQPYSVPSGYKRSESAGGKYLGYAFFGRQDYRLCEPFLYPEDRRFDFYRYTGGCRAG